MIRSDDIQKIALLSCLRVTQHDETLIIESLNKLLSYFEELKSIDTTGVEPLFQTKDKIDFRTDVPEKQLNTTDFLQNTASIVEGYIRMPQVVSHEER